MHATTDRNETMHLYIIPTQSIILRQCTSSNAFIFCYKQIILVYHSIIRPLASITGNIENSERWLALLGCDFVCLVWKITRV